MLWKINFLVFIALPFGFPLGPPSPDSPSDAPKVPKGDYFDVILDRFEQVEVNTEFCDWDLKAKRFNKTLRALFGTITVAKDLGNNIYIAVTTYKKQGGEYRLLPYHVSQAPFCNAFGEDPYVYADLAKKSDLPPNMKLACPLKPGKYNIDGAQFPLTEAPRSAFQSGDYMAEFVFTQNDEVLGRFRVYAMIINIS